MSKVVRSWRWVRTHRGGVYGGLVTAGLLLRWLTDSRWSSVAVGVVVGAFVLGVLLVPWCVLIGRSFRAGLDGELEDPPA